MNLARSTHEHRNAQPVWLTHASHQRRRRCVATTVDGNPTAFIRDIASDLIEPVEPFGAGCCGPVW